MWQHLKEKNIKLPPLDWKEINKELNPVLRDMEKVGVKLDVDLLNKTSKEVQAKLAEIEKEIYQCANCEFNINSPIQLAEILFEKLKLPTTDLRRTKSGYSTAASELRKIASQHKVIKPLLEYRELAKLLSTYLKPLPLLVDEHHRLHTTYGQDTSTGRLTSSEPNLQNIPVKGERGAEIRKAFIADEGKLLISADYSQIELRIVACLAEDEAMIQAFHDNEDIHSRTAAEIFNLPLKEINANHRRVAKTVNFGVLYGMSPYGLSQTLGIEREQASQFIKKYFEAHPGIRKYCDDMIDKAHKEGFVETLFGYTRTFPNINSPFHNVAQAEERMAINTPVQGSAAEVLKLAMINLHRELDKNYKSSAHLLLTIHDELIVEVDPDKAAPVAKLVQEVMENSISLCVPLSVEVEIGQNWEEMKPVPDLTH